MVVGSSSWRLWLCMCSCQSGTWSRLSGLAPELATSLKASGTQSHISWIAHSALFVSNNAIVGGTGCLALPCRLLNNFIIFALSVCMLSHLLLLFKLAEVLRYHKRIRWIWEHLCRCVIRRIVHQNCKSRAIWKATWASSSRWSEFFIVSFDFDWAQFWMLCGVIGLLHIYLFSWIRIL